MKKFFKVTAALLTVICITIFSEIIIVSKNTPNLIYSNEIENNFEKKYVNCSVVNSGTNVPVYRIKLLNTIPIKDVAVLKSADKNVLLGGTQFGVKIHSSGCVVTAISGVLTDNGCINPADQAGLKKGDIIISINDQTVLSNSDVERIVANSNTKLKIVYERKGQKCSTYAYSAVSSADGQKRLGIWIKNSIGGIGTTTFIDPQNGIVAGLGHGIYENETDVLMPLNDGAICKVDFNSVNKSTTGCIGEIDADLCSENCGKVLINSDCGIYATTDVCEGVSIPIADTREIKKGDAMLYLSLDGGKCDYYSCEIEKIIYSARYKHMVIKITDERLLQKTGGIVQGMSGTPIVQNGKLIGALTHVFVNDCERGYGIFAVNMLMEAENANAVS